MAETSKAGPTLLKTLAGVAFMAGSVGLFVHRIPKKRYVDVHADKPRPAAAKPAALAAAPRSKAPAAPAKPGAGKKAAPGQVASASAVDASASAESPEDWQDSCSAEIGILCNNVAEKRLPRCLHQYDDSIRKDCLKALLLLANDPRAADL